EGHPELARPREEAGADEGPKACRREELKPLGQRVEPAAPHDERPAEAVVRSHEAIAEADPVAQGQGPRPLGKERGRAALDEESLAALGREGAAEPVGRLEHGDLDGARTLARPLDSPMCGGEAGDAAAHDDELHGSAEARSTRSASISMKRGWSFAAS